jgi:hypothetical protein
MPGPPMGMKRSVQQPTSWLTIEPGWDVEDASATVVGEVTAVIGDPDADIFDGLRFETTDGVELFAPGEKVGAIVEGRVTIQARLERLQQAPAEGEPGGAEIRPEAPGEA